MTKIKEISMEQLTKQKRWLKGKRYLAIDNLDLEYIDFRKFQMFLSNLFLLKRAEGISIKGALVIENKKQGEKK